MTASTNQLPATIVSTPIVNVPALAPFAAAPLSVHPAAMLFPMMKGTDFGGLVEDIDTNGLREPIVVFQGQILDGRNRLRACEIAGVEPRFVEWDGVGSPLAFVVSRNLHRRHLNESQRSLIGAQVKAMFEEEAAERKAATQFGEDPRTPTDGLGDDEKHREITVGANLHPPCAKANAQAAAMLNVSARSVATASKVLDSGAEEVIGEIMAGKVSVSDAAAVADLPKEEQRHALEAVRSGRARTLRQAADIEPDDEPPSPKVDDDREQPFSRKRLRIECKRFSGELDKLLRRLDTVTLVCGGPNDYTRRVRDCLSVALRAIHDCVNQFGRAKR
ncbi:MAG: ParB N-terminal domain-containing protein [Pirellulales bacterium]